ncbi:MAG: hypothetical protein R8L07_03610 [Alphaproteobacteria bacterium]|nr:hypothetical protein [Alphaproteobacteria bacterium]
MTDTPETAGVKETPTRSKTWIKFDRPSISGFWFVVGLLIALFYGDPDLHDALISYLQRH